MPKTFHDMQAEANLITGCYDLTKMLTSVPDNIVHQTLITVSDSMIAEKDVYTRNVKQLYVDFLQAVIRYNTVNEQLHNRSV